MGAPPHAPEYVVDRSTHSGTESVLPACSGASHAEPMSSCPCAARGLTNTDSCDDALGVHRLLTVTGARAQYVASADRVPLLSTLRRPLYALSTSNCATLLTVVPSCERTCASLYVQLTPCPLKVAATPIVSDVMRVVPTDGSMALRPTTASEMAKL
jgi:hypothetical protein